ncbi:MAG: trypsin-like peptidase domain-containing protein [Ginsengibacter sp.]
MFVNAIEEVSKFTRPVHTITRNYKETLVSPGAATFFFVNDNGVALTCKHVIDLIGNRQSINDNYEKFKAEKNLVGKNNKYNQRVKVLEEKYNYKADTIIQIQELFVDVTSDTASSYKWITHSVYDLAIIIFENFKNPLYQSCAKFIKDSSTLKQGLFLCRLGYPFPEFNNFRYDAANDTLEWINSGQIGSPRFPIEGMLTRHLTNDGQVVGIELSTPGLRGQSGGPLFTTDGVIAGMQVSTNHLHLGFDMKNFEYNTNGRIIKVTNQPFLHVGHCIHVDIIKKFLKDNNIKYYEE